MNVVFDTNVLISAFITEGVCSGLLLRARKSEFNLFICPAIIEEFKNVLFTKLRASKTLIDETVSIISEASLMIYPANAVHNIVRDPDDDKILSCAVFAKASYLVSGDKDLLEIAEFRNIKIITPRDFEACFEN